MKKVGKIIRKIYKRLYHSSKMLIRPENVKKELLNNYVKSELVTPINQTKEEDVFIVGYPKSGNTWLQVLISGLYYGIDTQYLPVRLAQELIPGVHQRKFYRRYSDISFFKSHHLSLPRYKRVIYIVRDVRDVMVSFYHMDKEIGRNYSMEEIIKEGKGIHPSKWYEHIERWNENPFGADILVIKYENLHTNPYHEIKKICDFLKISRSDDLINKVIDGSSFQRLKNSFATDEGLLHSDWKRKDSSKFFRKGKIGSYKTELTENLEEYLLKEAQNAMKIHNYL
jgi:hypothetical protein